MNSNTGKMDKRVTPSDVLLDVIFERVANGKPLTKICKESGMPSKKTFLQWVEEDETTLQRYEAAMLMQADFYANQITKLAKKKTNTSEENAHNQLRINARKWVASKLNPKKYGDRVSHEILGADRKVQLVLTVNTAK